MFTQRISLSAQDARQVSTTQVHKLGTVAETADGRVFRYSSAGAVNLAAGLFNTTVAKVANHTNITVAAAYAVGVRQVTATLGATASTLDQYKDGYLVVNDSTGVGCAYRVEGNSAASSSGVVTVNLAEGVAIALTTSSKVSLVPNPWSGSIVSASAVALFCNGTNNVAAAASSYYWSQTQGIASALSDGVIGKGSGAILSDAVNGAVEVEVAGTVTQRIGWAPEATVDAKYYPLYLTLE
jgi:hypothetical protein